MHRLVLALTLASAGCSGLIAFDVDASGDSTVQGNALGSVLGTFPGFSGLGNMNLSQSSQFQNNNTDKGHISEAHLRKLTLTVTSPQGDKLDFISKIDFYVEAQGLDKVHIAGATVPAGVTTLDLTVDDRDIAPYVKQDTFSITTVATAHAPAHDTTIHADVTLHINASLL